MSYQALYRVWRPKTFEDVVGQSHITRTLQNAIYKEKFSHAYLFSGPRGTGKTSAAKIFAKAVNCERSPVKEPCGECSACRGIQDGTISDVIEIDAASNNGVDDIRDIRDKVKYAPSSIKYKVYIVDEVHMLSTGAFNALLKTLEEPPQHVIFILATTEPHKIPLTIISRCQRFDFKRISQAAIVDRLQNIMDAENVEVDKEALQTVALAAEGGMRDALSLLDQAISYSEENHVTTQDVLAVTGSVSQSKLGEVLESLFEKNVKSALQLIDEFLEEGKDSGRLVFDLIYYLRDLLLYQSSNEMGEFLERAIPDERFKKLTESCDSEWVQSAIRQLNECQQEMRWTNSPKVFIEIAMLNIADTKSESKPAAQITPQVTQKLEQLEKELKALKQSGVSQPADQKKAETRSPRRSSNGRKYRIPFERIRNVLDQASKTELKNIANHWASFMDSLKKDSPPAYAKLINSKPRAASEEALVLSFKYEIHCSLMLENQDVIESQLSSYLGKQVTIIPIPEEDWKGLREEYVKKQRQQDDTEGESSQNQDEDDPLITEARKLVGDDLLEIQDN
ncbi:DNA polymerase III subunit gamma/tau [Salinibacillus xinjiangensis]|uniref:DNA-directed DNA polymerase n=1 Tax=Salinibacillus xinjiangensis TaxID=1229268 RepID=A0A6G1XAB9_9BACI|nr:DNA polymerase III subunit gamma/tau [Salinibacillus xinjiangensis]MRG87924.1 DNA polymerase III subunit gamma/tau [Salinibacillus xinjiangensis]